MATTARAEAPQGTTPSSFVYSPEFNQYLSTGLPTYGAYFSQPNLPHDNTLDILLSTPTETIKQDHDKKKKRCFCCLW
ncbi:unnamed protein product [Vitrella brassicaformis CCMP3155]|uniref:Uncharacterized protein n=1 Tax=Vitrella brassicaformis (strain CCMP3155) TaxID=1169540 RepID=A0A0G4GT75_VITBC|nr:unnamed protein product [Vitrella brassicaformis CCMP3155]|eukprot:CEM33669.1 unnamed protein product [Vitrella brassicaformis CCMP3155]